MSTGSREPAPLRSSCKHLLAEYRGSGDIPDAAFARGLQRVQRRERAAASQRRSRTLVAVAAAVAIAAAVVAMLVAPSYIRQRDADTRRDQAVYGQRADDPRSARHADPQGQASPEKPSSLARPQSAPSPAEPVRAALEPSRAPIRAGPGPSPSPSKITRPPSPPTPDTADASPSSLAQERGLLRAAWNALAEGSSELARTKVAEHGRRFPDGVLAAERRAIVAIAACRGNDDDAKTVAERYLTGHAGDLLAGQVRASCAAVVENTAAP